MGSEHSTSGATPAPHPDDTGAAQLLARLHGARRRGDRDAARRAWVELVTAELPRVRGLVAGFRHHLLPGGRIPEGERDDVAQDVFLRLHQKAGTLRGESIGELREFMRTATRYACLDHVGRHVRDDRRRGTSLDDDGAAAAARERALGQLAERLAAHAAAGDEQRALVHAGLALVDPDKRAVLVMTAAGATTEEIGERLGIGRDALYQRRRRGLRQLEEAVRELMQEDDG